MKIALKYGLLMAISVIIYSQLIHFTMGEESAAGKGLSFLNYVLYTVAIVYGMLERRREQNGLLNYGQGLGIGMLITVIAAFINSIWTYINFKFINHAFVVTKMAEAQKQFEEKGLDEAGKDMALKMMKYMLSPGGLAIISLVGMIIMGLIISLIAAAILRKEDDYHPSTAVDNSADPYR